MTISLQSEKMQKKKNVQSTFERYQIQTEFVPHRYELPYPFLPRVNKIGLAKILLGELFEYNFKLVKSNYRKTLLSRPCIYGVFDGKFGGFSPIQKNCTGCMRCVEEYPEVCQVDRNPEFTHFTDSYWMPEDPKKVSESPFGTIWYEAQSGKIQVRGMGYKGLFAGEGWDSMWTDMSEIVRPTRDGVYGREFISTQIDIGKRPEKLQFPIRKRNLRISSTPIPMLFDYLPDNLLSQSIAKSILKAAEVTQTKCIFKPRQIDKYHLEVSDAVFLYVDEPNFGNIGSQISRVGGIIIDHSSLDLLERLRSIRPDIPIIARLPLRSDQLEELQELIEKGVEGFLLYADYHGRDLESSETFVKELIGSIHQKLVNQGLRDKITLLISGGITLAEHIPKAIIMGADGIMINTSALVALQVKFETECKIPEQSIISATEFDVEWGSKRLINLLGSWHNQLIEIMSAMGIKEVRRLRGDTGRAMYKEELEEVAFGDITRID